MSNWERDDVDPQDPEEEESLEEILKHFEDTAEESLDTLEDVGGEILEEVGVAVAETLGEATAALYNSVDEILDSPEPIPEIAEAEGFSESLGLGLEYMGKTLANHASVAIKVFTETSADHAKAASKVLIRMEELARLSLYKKIGPRSAEVALDNYLHALNLYKESIKNEAKVQSFLRGMAILESTKRVLFSLLTAGINAASPAAGTIVNGLSKVTNSLKDEE